MPVHDPVLDWAVGRGASPASLAGDAVSEVLDQLRVEGWFAGLSRLVDPFGVEVPVAGGGLMIVLGGELLISMSEDQDPVRLRPGELMLVLRGDRFTVRTSPGAPVRPITEVISPAQARRHEGVVSAEGDAAAVHLGAAIRLSGAHDERIRQALPPYIVGRWDGGTGCPMGPCVAWLRDYAGADPSGMRASINRHLAVLVIETIRRHLVSGGVDGGYLGALVDPRIGPVLALMRSRLAHAWSVESLALEAGLSRSAFCARFQELMGISPAAYLCVLRVERAAELLRSTRRSSAEIGRAVGYDSGTAFGAAFKRVKGTTPGRYRSITGAG